LWGYSGRITARRILPINFKPSVSAMDFIAVFFQNFGNAVNLSTHQIVKEVMEIGATTFCFSNDARLKGFSNFSYFLLVLGFFFSLVGFENLSCFVCVNHFFISYWLCILFVEGIGFIALLATLGFMTSWDLLPLSVGLDL
jgi:hypothetical protein